jgi:hypothetical protein
MSAPPIPDNVVSGLGVRGAGRGYFSRSIPFSKGGGVNALFLDGLPLLLDGGFLILSEA